jgi:hypothetical protein
MSPDSVAVVCAPCEPVPVCNVDWCLRPSCLLLPGSLALCWAPKFGMGTLFGSPCVPMTPMLPLSAPPHSSELVRARIAVPSCHAFHGTHGDTPPPHLGSGIRTRRDVRCRGSEVDGRG